MTLFMLISIALAGWLYLYQNFKKSNILTLLTISYLLFYDLLTIVYVYKNNAKIDDITSFLLLFYIYFSTFLIVFTCNILFQKQYIENISFKMIVDKANLFSDRLLALSFLVTTGVIAYYFLRYNLIFRVSSEYSQSQVLNTYGIVISSFVLPAYVMILIVSISKLSNNNQKYRFYYFSILFFIMTYFLLYGRREFILGILLIALIFSYQKNSNLFSIKKIPLLLFGFFIVIIASNFYQNIRFQVASYAITHELVLKKSIIDYAFDFKSSDKNIEDRTSIYDFTYILVDKLFIKEIEPLGGEILLQSFINVIPSIIYPEKIVINDDALINNGLKLPNKDNPNSILSSVLVDFGAFAFLIYPVFMIINIGISLYLINKFKNNILLYLLLTSTLIYTLFNVEEVISSSFTSLRNMLLLVLFMQTMHYLNLIFKRAVK